jgi:BlaI family transcriptional regulator, penicillinase repressor
MARLKTPKPTERELEVLQILWDAGSASLSEICQALRQDRDVATTTVATVLKVMHDKEFVERTADRRWRACVSRRATIRTIMRRVIDQVFDGSARRMVAQLLETERLSESDIAGLRRLLDEYHPKN